MKIRAAQMLLHPVVPVNMCASSNSKSYGIPRRIIQISPRRPDKQADILGGFSQLLIEILE
jgi:hypothetical protein